MTLLFPEVKTWKRNKSKTSISIWKKDRVSQVLRAAAQARPKVPVPQIHQSTTVSGDQNSSKCWGSSTTSELWTWISSKKKLISAGYPVGSLSSQITSTKISNSNFCISNHRLRVWHKSKNLKNKRKISKSNKEFHRFKSSSILRKSLSKVKKIHNLRCN